jgi:DNA-binding IclR family transcriptional regulator
MGNVSKVFAQIEGNALTPEEISERSGLSISKVKETLDFLEEFSLVKVKGPRVTVSEEIMDLPEG